jgi:death-on-curing protein
VTDPVEYLDLDDLITLATLLLGDPPPVRDVGLLEAAAARPRTSAFEKDAYPGLRSKAAALLQSIVKNHALIDGNKRLGWLGTAVFLELNGVEVTRISNDDVYDLVLEAAGGADDVEELAGRLQRIVTGSRPR